MGNLLKIIIGAGLLFPANLKAEPMDDLAADLSGQIKSTQTVKLAVLTFPYIDGFNSTGSQIVQERLITAFSRDKKFSLLERALLHKVLEQAKLEMSGLFDETATVKLGKLLGVEAVLTGTLIDINDRETEINARIINAKTGEILASGKANILRIWTDKTKGPMPIFNPTPVPEIEEVKAPESYLMIEMEYDDIETLEKYDEAARFDKGSASPLEKAEKWKEFAMSSPRYEKLSMERAKEWEVYDREFKESEKLKLQKLEAMKKDYQTLSRYFALTVISQKQKVEWVQKFMENYGWGPDNVYINEMEPFLARPAAGGEWLFVPGDPSLGTGAFWVQKYEAKKDAGGVAVSRPAGEPWVNTQIDAKRNCEALGPGYHLLTMEEAQTISRNIENNDQNWTGGKVGSGGLWRGHTDEKPGEILAADINGDPDDNPYTGTENVFPSIEKRTHQLSTGEYIWDWSGNLWEWLDLTCTAGTGAGYWYESGDWIEWSDGNLSDYEKGRAGPAGAYTSAHNAGRYYGCSVAGNAVLRGGGAGNGAIAGVFTFNALKPPSFWNPGVGFRCGKNIRNTESEKPIKTQ